MKPLVLLVCGLGWASTAAAAEPVLEVRWEDEAAKAPLVAGSLLPGTPGGALRIETDSDGPHESVVWVVENPPVKGKRWRLEGQVRYLNVKGEGQLVLLSTLEGRDYFTKTVAPSGPLGRLTGHSDWRPFVLPFDALDKAVPPEKIRLQVFLPAEGTVDLGTLRLYEGFDDDLVKDLGPRLGWNAATLGIAAGLLGSLFGFLGTLVGLLGAMKKGPRPIKIVQRIAVAIGVVAIAVGLAATFSGAAGGWLISVGLIGVVLFSALDKVVQKAAGAGHSAE